MGYDSRNMKYTDERDAAQPKDKKLTREDFKKDVAEAVKKGIAKPKKKRAPKASKYKKGGSYENMSVSDLRRFINEKKKKLLVKSGFPDGRVPRSKAAMVALCKALKRKRW